MTPSAAAERPLLGIAYALAWTGCISLVDALAKWLVAEIAIFQLLAIRGVFVMVLLVPVLRRGGLSALRTRRPLAHLGRFIITMVSLFAFFTSLRHLPLATATLLAFTSPLFLTGLSHLLLRERVDAHRWVALVAGFLGVLLIARPGGEIADSWAAALATLSGLTYALSTLAVRWMAPTESDVSFVFYINAGSLVLGAASLPFVWQPLALLDLILIAAQAGLLVLGQFLMVRAFRNAPVATVAPFQYAEVVIAAVIGLVVWGEFPGLQVWAGAVVVVGSGLYITLHEARRRRRSIAEPSPAD